MLHALKRFVRARLDYASLPAVAKAEKHKDHKGLPATDPGNDTVEAACLRWLCDAQDLSKTSDGGASRDFSLVSGWAPSYPETSGYIVPTLLEAGIRRDEPDLIERARRMVDWLVSIQFAEGGFQGGTIGAVPVVPVTFNTGQILMGLAAAVRHFGQAYTEPMHRAADWLVDTMDPDGCWRKFPTPFAAPGEKAYETHVAWGLIEAAKATSDPASAKKYAEAALRNARWAISKQHQNGWFDCCCLVDPDAPLTHTIGYALRGLTEIFLHTREADVLSAATRTAKSVAARVSADGFLAGKLDSKWQSAADWACVTGSAQIAHSLLLIARETGDSTLVGPAHALLSYARRTVQIDGPVGVRGGVKGSFPVDGEYCSYQFPNWAAKFLIDAVNSERSVSAA